MTDEKEGLRFQVSDNHRRVISVRMQLLEQSCLRLLSLFDDVDSALMVRRGLARGKAEAVQHLVSELRSQISQMKSDLSLQQAERDARREAAALVAAMTVNIEEVHPHYLKGYGKVPEGLAHYLENRINELLRTMEEIGRALDNTVGDVEPET